MASGSQENRAALPGGGRRKAVVFVVLIGCVSLFADMTYEGARSIVGPFLSTLGASAVVVSVVAGLGEFLATACAISPGAPPIAAAATGRS